MNEFLKTPWPYVDFHHQNISNFGFLYSLLTGVAAGAYNNDIHALTM